MVALILCLFLGLVYLTVCVTDSLEEIIVCCCHSIDSSISRGSIIKRCPFVLR